MLGFAEKRFEIPSNWKYRGEGNCNVVISLPREKKILRVRKIAKQISFFTWIVNWLTNILQWYCGNSYQEEQRDIIFYKKIIRPLLGISFVCDAEQVFLSKKQIKSLERDMSSQRPSFRKFKNLQHRRASIFDDYAFLPEDFYPFQLSRDTYAVEIKPKQGWVPFSERQFSKCTFCMNQYVKKGRGQIKSITSYCPRDLFSGELPKMVKSLKALIENPQNNLKIFKNGLLYYSEKTEHDFFDVLLNEIFNTKSGLNENVLSSEFCLFISKCLLTNFNFLEKKNNCDIKLFCEWNNIIKENSYQTKLPQGCVLERILSVQMLDVEGNQYYHKLLGNKNFGEYDYVKELIDETIKKSKTCLKCIIMLLGNTEEENLTQTSLALVPYLISAIARDCSLMITFQRILEETSDSFGMKNVISTKYGDFVVNLGIFDLYPKPVSTILKHRDNFKKMLDSSGSPKF